MRVSQPLLRRLTALEDRRASVRCIGLWPAIMELDDWERVAVSTQGRLVSDTAWEPSETLPAAPLADLSDISHRYKQVGNQVRRGQTVEERRMLGEESDAQAEYAEAYVRGERRPDLINRR